MVLRQLGRVNYHIKPEVGKAKTKVVHQNHLKRLVSRLNSELPKINEIKEPVINHHEEEQLTVSQETQLLLEDCAVRPVYVDSQIGIKTLL